MTCANNRVVGLDIIKCFAAILIVFLHWPVSNVVGQAVHMMARPAVPLFFMTTGYFFHGIISKGTQWKYMKKILQLTAYSYILYFLIYILYGSKIVFSRVSICIWLLTGQNAVGGHLWYLNTLILAVLLIVVLTKITSLQKLHWLIPILFAGNYIISCLDVPVCYYRNALFTGIPYIFLGNWIRVNNAKWTWSSKRFLFMAVMCFGLLFCEVMTYRMGGAIEHREHFLMLIPISIFVFVWGVKYEQESSNMIVDIISMMGRDYSQYIYVYHYTILGTIGMYISGLLQPIFAIILSIFFSYLHVSIKRHICLK